jgi:hypothetical protein
VTEQPYKIPYYAALLRLLHDTEVKAGTTEGTSLGKQILEDFWKGFQAFLDKLAWREARLCVSMHSKVRSAWLKHWTDTFLRTPDSRQSHFTRVPHLAPAIIYNGSR